MFNFENCTIPTSNGVEIPVNKQETAKSILEDIDGILKALANEMRMIEEAIYSKEPLSEGISEQKDECLLGTLCRQRETAERLLKKAVHIRGGLW